MTQIELDWSEHADLHDYCLLKWFSFSAPFWVLATYLLCAWHTYKYVKRMPQKLLEDLRRDRTIIILALPFVYGFMSLRAVMHTWQITRSSMTMAINFLDGSVRHAMQLLILAYEANFAVADFYEAFALWTFAKLTLGVMGKKSEEMEKRHKKNRENVEKLMNDNVNARQDEETLRIRRQSLAEKTTQEAEFDELEKMTRKTTQELAMIGVRYFCISCLLSAFCALVPIELYYFDSEQAEMNFVHTWLTKVSNAYEGGILTGMGFIASFCAIENIIIVEHQFGEKHFPEFRATTKFWSTKVLVSLVFIQSSGEALLPGLSTLSITRQKLLHASLLSCECFFISLFHFKAWNENETWYKDFGSGERSQRLLPDSSDSD